VAAALTAPATLPRLPLAVVFDMDGLLFDTEALYREAIVTVAARRGHDSASPVFANLVGLPWPLSRRLLVEHFGAAFPIDAFMTEWLSHFDEIAAARMAMKSGVIELLDTLDELAIPRAIATASSRGTVARHLAAHALVERFPHVVGAGDDQQSKPAPDRLLKAAGLPGVEPRFCLALEDPHNGVRSATSAGMMTVMVPDLHEPTDEIRALCVFIACDLHEVRARILTTVAAAP
jgi:HAD superfamily hydrolase (TIGR01509 family)